VTLSTIKIKSLWILACAGMTIVNSGMAAVAFIAFMFLNAAFIVFPLHDMA